MIIPSLNEATLRQHSSEQSFSRGRQYYRDGAVISLVRRGNALLAEVEGSEFTPYRVRVVFAEDRITEAECTCPYDWGGWCKHVVAVLLACIEEPESVEERPPLESLLADLSRNQLRELLLGLAADDPGLAERVELRLGVMKTAAAAPPNTAPARRTPVDPRPFRRQVQAAIHSLDRLRPYEAYHQVGSVVSEIRSLLNKAEDFIAGDDGRNALIILEAITDEYIEEWTELDDSDGEVSSVFADLGPLWTEALLSADLNANEREAWAEKLSEWQEAVEEYGLDETFEAAITAAEVGWDDPSLQRLLKGEAVPEPAAAEEDDEYDAELASAYLNVLERRGQYREYLNLAKASGQMGAYVLMLVRLDRLEEAATGIRSLQQAQDAFRLAQALREREQPALALQVAEHGLTLEGLKGELAAWTRDLAVDLGEPERALRAAVMAFKEAPSLDNYLKAKERAGDDWPAQQPALLEHLRRTDLYIPAERKVDVFLHEKRFDDAMAAVEKHAYYETLARVMDAVIEYRPEWVIKNARKQAEEIMDAGKSDRYDQAVGWLKKAGSSVPSVVNMSKPQYVVVDSGCQVQHVDGTTGDPEEPKSTGSVPGGGPGARVARLSEGNSHRSRAQVQVDGVDEGVVSHEADVAGHTDRRYHAE